MKQHFEVLSNFHRWAFQTLNRAVAGLADERYQQPCGLFFDSVHGTLNHLLVADKIWYGRFTNEPFNGAGLDAELHRDRESLALALDRQAAKWLIWVKAQTDDSIGGQISYQNLAGDKFTDNIGLTLAHVFNHATHHRGQVSAALGQFGLEVPALDLIYFLRSAERT